MSPWLSCLQPLPIRTSSNNCWRLQATINAKSECKTLISCITFFFQPTLSLGGKSGKTRSRIAGARLSRMSITEVLEAAAAPVEEDIFWIVSSWPCSCCCCAAAAAAWLISRRTARDSRRIWTARRRARGRHWQSITKANPSASTRADFSDRLVVTAASWEIKLMTIMKTECHYVVSLQYP